MRSRSAEWTIELFGGLRARRAEREITRFRTHKTAALLAYLAYNRLAPHPRELLIDLLWGNGTPEAGRQSLSKSLSSLRHQLEPPGVTPGSILFADRSSVQLCPASVTTDVVRFESALREAARARGPLERVQRLMEAVQLYRGELLPGFYEEWVLRERERLRELLQGALSRLIGHFVQAGDLERALEYAQTAVSADPLREEAYVALMQVHAVRGGRAEALREYATLERTLREELALSPSAETQALAAALREAKEPPKERARERQVEESTGIPPIAPSPSRLATGPPGKTSLLTEIPGGTLTFLLIDSHEDPAAEGHTLLRREINRHAGSEAKALGGVFAAAFARASDAAAGAAACREAWRAAGGGEAPRMALDTGEVELQSGRYRGVVLDRAARVLLAAHPGQILCSEQTAVLLRWDLEPGLRLIDLGLYRLGELPDSAVFPMPERLFQLESSGAPPRSFPAPNAEGGYQAHLPLPLTRFFGREAEIERLGKLLLAPDRRLISLIGPGGSGKTRLALEVAGRLVEPYQGSVWFVSLVDVPHPHLIPPAILDVLHLFPAAGRDPLEQATAFLSRQPSLLVLDNFEHLVSEGTELVQRLVTETTALTCLITSRQRLGLDGEREFRVLPLPTPEADDSPERLAQCASVRLFVDRAQAVQPDFQVTRGTATEIAALCRRLEGIPLALELAAARAAVLAPAQILARLDHRLDFLTRERRDVPPRHRSLRAALDGSYQLLAEGSRGRDIQRLFARLSVFRGGWTLEAAEAVCDEPLALDGLAQLQECSLVLAEAGASETRYRMLETVREYAEAMLSRGQRAELSRRHADYFASYAERAEAEWTRGERAGAAGLEQLTGEHENLRAALAWSLADGDRSGAHPASPATHPPRACEVGDLGVRLAAAMWAFWPFYGHHPEGRHWLDRALCQDITVELPRVRARLLLGTGWLLQLHGEYVSARTFCEESLVAFQAADEPVGRAHALSRLGWIAYSQNDRARARALWEEARSLWKAAGSAGHCVELLRHLHDLAASQKDPATATALQEEALALMRQMGEPAAAAARLVSAVARVRQQQGDADFFTTAAEGVAIAREFEPHPEIAHALDQVGSVARERGEYQWARALLEQGLKMHRALGTRIDIHLDLWRLAQVARLAGDLSAARAWAEESLQVARELGSKEPIAHTLDELRLIAVKQGDWQIACSLPRESLTLWQELGNHWGLAEALEGAAHLAIAHGQALEGSHGFSRSRLRDAGRRTARLLGAAERLRETIGRFHQPHERADYAQSVQAARAVLGEAAFAAAWADGRSLSPEQAVAEALER